MSKEKHNNRTRRVRKKSRHPIAIDLFSGCGGLTVGLNRAGFKVIWAIDSDQLAAKTYKANHPNVNFKFADITKIKPSKIRKKLGLRKGELDLLAGCPPCQGFSRIRTLNGSRDLSDSHNVGLKDLVFRFVDFVLEFRPKTVMMENVPGLLTDERMDNILRSLGEAGYHVPEGDDYSPVARILNAANYGVPQRRNRMILMMSRFGVIKFAKPIPEDKHVTVGEAFSSLDIGPAGESGDPLHDFPERRSPEVKHRIQQIPLDGGSRSSLKDQLACHKSSDGFKDVYGRMALSKVAPTITCGCTNPSKGRFLHPTEHRAITLREAATLQSFPNDYFFSLDRGKTGAARLIGNAFPPAFITPHARKIRKHISKYSRNRAMTGH